MADRTIPAPTSGRVTPAPGASPSPGGGGGAKHVDWIDLPLDPQNGWTRVNGTVDGQYCDANVVNDVLVVDMHGNGGTGVNGSFRHTGNTKEGFMLIRSDYIDVFADAGMQRPASEPAHRLQPEKFLIKLEVVFDTVPMTGPAGAPPGGSNYGNVLMVDAGIAHYASDQGGNPVMPGNHENLAATLWKTVADPSSSGNVFKSGHNNYQGTSATWTKMQCQATYGTTGCDTLVWIAGNPLHKRRNLSQRLLAGAYSSTDPYGDATLALYENNSVSAFLDDRYCHIAITFGAYNWELTRGQIRIKKIRYCVQPILGREPFTAV